MNYISTECPEKRDQKYFLRNFNKFARIAIVFGKQRSVPVCTGKLLVEQNVHSPSRLISAATLPCKMKRLLRLTRQAVVLIICSIM